MKRILIRNKGPNEQNIPKAFAAGIKLCKELDVTELTLVMPTKGSWGVVGTFLTGNVVKRLDKGEAVKESDGVFIRSESMATIQKAGFKKAVLVFYVDEKGMKIIDGMQGLEGIVYVPWREDEGNAWQQRWNAVVPGEQVLPHEPNLPTKVVAALEDLTRSINLSNGLTHPSDIKYTKRMFENLLTQGEEITPSEIEVWAIRHEWSPKNAASLRMMAEKFVK